ncbi:GrpB family protein, partial [Brevibacillus sp. SIMBA_076]
RHLAFRDYLRTFPDVRDDYGALKLQLAAQHPEDMEGYIQGKHNWIIETERLATQWYKENHGV